MERIFLSGDGAPWIQVGKEILPNCNFVIDGFHLSKYIRSATGPYPSYERKLKTYVYKGMKDFVEAYFETIEANDHSPAEIKRFSSCKTYILGNGIVSKIEIEKGIWNAVPRAISVTYYPIN